MDAISVKDIVEATGARLTSGLAEDEISGATIDSRNISKGDLFVALPGTRVDGHDFVRAAANQGAGAALVSRPTPPPRPYFPILQVEDTERSLGDLATAYRRRYDIPLVAITGSNGKTTTKEMTAYLLSKMGKTIWTQGNYNNFLGLPLSTFQIDSETEYAILEMGANAHGEIRRLGEIGQPTMGVITNIGAAHLEGFGSLEGVQKAKGELIESLEDKTFITNGDDPRCQKIAEKHRGRVVTFGREPWVDLQATEMKSVDKGISFTVDGHRCHLPLLGKHNIYNALAAIAVARELDLDPELYIDWSDFSPPSLRLERTTLKGITFINDCYNANPHSVRAALQTLADLSCSRRKVLVLGDMLELGEDSEEFHRELADIANENRFSLSVAVGEKMGAFHQRMLELGGPVVHFPDREQAREFLEKFLREGDLVLLKASRGMALEEIYLQWAA